MRLFVSSNNRFTFGYNKMS